jgi:hypothetical protein
MDGEKKKMINVCDKIDCWRNAKYKINNEEVCLWHKIVY